ncbi:hypothetical protein ACKGJI_04640 [Sulfurospirillum sp. 1307]
MKKNNKSFLFWLFLLVLFFFLLGLYGFYEKNRRIQLYKDFRVNKQILCENTIIQKSRGWKIKNNRFFSNGKIIKTIVYCKSLNK